MGDNYWIGNAKAVKQVVTCTIAGTIAVDDVFTMKINGETIATFTATDTTIATVVAALTAAWNNSTSVYVDSLVTAAANSPDIVLTSYIAGLPFDAGSNGLTLEEDAAGATFTKVETTASAGPNHWDTATNWSLGAVPVDDDVVVVDAPSARILWGLDQSTVNCELRLLDFTLIGLRDNVFCISADGSETTDERPEYRPTWLNIEFDELTIGHSGAPSIARCKLDLIQAGETNTIRIRGTGSSVDVGLPAVRIKSDRAQAHPVVVDSGTVGFATEDPFGEFKGGLLTVNGGSVTVNGYGVGDTEFSGLRANGGITYIGENPQAGVGVSGIVVNSGAVVYNSQDTNPTSIVVNDGGKYVDRATGSGLVTAVTIADGGEVDARMVGAITYSTVTLERGGTFRRGPGLTVSTLTLPTDEPYTMVLA